MKRCQEPNSDLVPDTFASALDQVATESQLVALSYTGTVSSPTITSTTATTYSYYNNLGDLTKQINPGTAGTDDQTIKFEYNVLGQRTAEKWFDNSSSSTITNTISYQYSVLDALSLAADSYGASDSRNSKLTFTTDAFGDVTQVDNHGGESDGTVAAPHVVLNAQFDANGNRYSLDAVVAGNNDFQDTIGFDYLNRETSIVRQAASGGNTVAYLKSAFSYDAGSELTSVADYTTSTAELTHGSIAYDRAGRVASVQWHDDAHTGSGYGGAGNTGYWEQLFYTNDNNSRVTALSSSEYSSENATYSYDHTSQLTEEDLGSAYGGYGGPASKHLFTWDANGNPIGSSVGTPTGYGGYYYVTDNGYLIGDGNRLLSDGNYKYQFDAAGRLIKKFGIATGTIAEVDYSWDNRSRLVEVQNRSSVGGSVTLDIQYVYDMFDRLISRTQGSTTTLFAYDGQRMVLAFTSSGGISDRYVWGPAVDQILEDEHYTTPSTSSAGTRYFTTFDKENSVRDLISSSDSLSGHVAYNSFGQITSSTIGYTMPVLHEGVYTDSATGMEYHSDPSTGIAGRWYDPASKRWISEDPTGLAPDSNPYRSDHNSPTNLVDPSGLSGKGKDGPPNISTFAKDNAAITNGYWIIIATDGDPNDDFGGTGHSWIAIVNKQTTSGATNDSITTQIDVRGFRPEHGDGMDQLPCAGKLTDEDANRRFRHAAARPITRKQYEKLIQDFQTMKDRPGNFQIRDHNCTAFVNNELQSNSMGLSIRPDDRTLFKGFGPWVAPSSLAKTIDGPLPFPWIRFDPGQNLDPDRDKPYVDYDYEE